MSIPIDASLPESEGEIPGSVASLPEEIEAPETQPPLISFRRYNERECEVGQGQMFPYALSALQTIKGMGTQVGFAPNSTYIINDGEYKKLYRGLSDIPDVSIYEIKLEGKAIENGKKVRIHKGRIFYFRADNTISMVAIRANHYDTDKVRS